METGDALRTLAIAVEELSDAVDHVARRSDARVYGVGPQDLPQRLDRVRERTFRVLEGDRRDVEDAHAEEDEGPLFGSWLAVTRGLQRVAYGLDPEELEGEDYGDFLGWNVTALVAELGELLAESPAWKTWVTERRRDDDDARGRMVGELVDLLHFAGNLLVLLRCSDEELSDAYAAKVVRNRDRMRSGAYDGRAKCPGCRRALDDVGTIGNVMGRRRCRACGDVVDDN